LFDLFDVDGNGSIDRKEMVEIFKVSVTIRYLYIWGLLDGDDGVTLSVRKLKKKTAYIIKYIYIYIIVEFSSCILQLLSIKPPYM
jgi:hypothetical protein